MKMNQQPIKTARNSSCSTKKSSKNTCRSASSGKRNLQNTLINMNNLSLILGNNSTITQRKSHSKIKGFSKINTEKENRQDSGKAISSSKKQPKSISALKTDRKAQYTKLKAKQIQTQIMKKQSSALKSSKKTKRDIIQVIDGDKLEEDECNKIYFGNNQTKTNSFLSEGIHWTAEMKKNSDSFAMSEIQKNQKQLIQKIAFLEQQNSSLSHKNEAQFNSIKFNHEEEVNYLKEQMRILSSKLNQNSSKNYSLEQKVASNQKEFVSLREKLQQKDLRISYLENQNQLLQKEYKIAKDSISKDKASFDNLQRDILELKSERSSLQEQVAKGEKEKKHIKQNCVQVLALLREEFGDELKFLSC